MINNGGFKGGGGYAYVRERLGIVSVKDFGATGNGVTDDTAAIQAALDASRYGGVVYLPVAPYAVGGTLVVPEGVTLEGSFQAPTAGASANGGFEEGSALIVTSTGGSATGNALITLKRNATLRGIVIFYPNQTDTNPPIAYPYTVSAAGDSISVENCLLVNPYQGIEIVGYQRPYLRAVYMQALKQGIYLDQIYDIPRLEDIHIWPFWKVFSYDSGVGQYQLANATAYTFGDISDVFGVNLFAYGYANGIEAIASPITGGLPYGQLINIDIDGSQNAINIAATALDGLKITNLEVHTMYGTNPTGIILSGQGLLQITNAVLNGGDGSGGSQMAYANLDIQASAGANVMLENIRFANCVEAAIIIANSQSNIVANNLQFNVPGTALDLSALSSSDSNIKSFSNAMFLTASNVVNPNNAPWQNHGQVSSLSTATVVSGTIYQNNSGNVQTFYQPAYASTAGTAGSVAVALGTSSSPSTLYTDLIDAGTTSSVPRTLTLRVPPGWYYSFTATGATLADAMIQGE